MPAQRTAIVLSSILFVLTATAARAAGTLAPQLTLDSTVDNASTAALSPHANAWTEVDAPSKIDCERALSCTLITNVDVQIMGQNGNLCTFIDGVEAPGCVSFVGPGGTQSSIHAHQSAKVQRGKHNVVTKILFDGANDFVSYFVCDYAVYYQQN